MAKNGDQDVFLHRFKWLALVVSLLLVIFMAIIGPLSMLALERTVTVSEPMFFGLLAFAGALMGLSTPDFLRRRKNGNGDDSGTA